MADYTLAPDRIALAAVGVLSMALFAARSAGLLAGSASAALVPSAIALATLAFQYAVVVRRRPALSPDLRGADDMIRRLAATRGFARPGIAAAIAALAYALQPEGSPMDWVQLGLLLVAVGWLFSGREARSPKLLASFAPA